MDFNASAKGCKKPQKPTTLGPLRRCIAAKTFLSNKVNMAIQIIINKMAITDSKKYVMKIPHNYV